MGYAAWVLDPEVDSPATQVTPQTLQAAYDDPSALAELAQHCRAVTTEFENVPAQALRALATQGCRVSPPARAVEIAQDRVLEKAHLLKLGLPCGPHQALVQLEDLSNASLSDLCPGILKTARLGYDGRGQIQVVTPEELPAAWAQLGPSLKSPKSPGEQLVSAVLEKRLSLAAEYSVILARSLTGDCVCLPTQRNVHDQGILAVTQVFEGQISESLNHSLQQAARTLAHSLDYVGVLCVEFFVLETGEWLINEIAPRPHNSGHYSLDACDISQFDLQVRTLMGLPLISPRLHSQALMLNVLGEAWFVDEANPSPTSPPMRPPPKTPHWAQVVSLPGVHLHLYGKHAPRPGRKMGHITITGSTSQQVYDTAHQIAHELRLNYVQRSLAFLN
jgi:5-(carboxyamino)imidazole ribonucleotide synthase